jgi:hypothetical protein
MSYMEIVWEQWYRLIIVAIAAGAVISVMIFMRAAASGSSKSETRKTIVSFWAALLATIGSMIVASTYAGGSLLDVNVKPFSVQAAPVEGATAAALVVSVVITIILWGLTIRQVNQLNTNPIPGPSESEQEESTDDSD